jgi:hypothetical protein
MVLLLDEPERSFTPCLDSPEKAREWNRFFGVLRAFCDEGKLVMFISDIEVRINRLNRWPHENMDTNPVFNFFKEHHLTMFNAEQTETMLMGIGGLMGLDVSKEAADEIHRASGGQPFIARLLGSSAAKDCADHRMTEEIVRHAVEGFMQIPQLAEYCLDLIDYAGRRAGPTAQSMLKGVALGDTEVAEVYIRAVNGRGTKDEELAASALKELDLIEEIDRKPHCKIGLLERYLKK